jgi:predicted amidohydrolase YtcJ
MSVVFRDVDVSGRRVDVRVEHGVVTAVGLNLGGDQTVAGEGGALLPGLHDHHVHVLALAATLSSVDADTEDLANALQGAPGDGWVRATGYHEHRSGHLDRHSLDAIVSDRPVRVQHRSGALWVLNTRALELVHLDHSPDVERDADGEPTGRLWRYDERLRPSVADAPAPDVEAVGRLLAGYGITGLTDATPELDASALELLDRLPQRVTTLSRDGNGPRKIALRDHDLPSLEELTDTIRAVHADTRPVAVHCVTRESLLLTLAAVELAGSRPGDRIEHASVVPDGVAQWMARLGVRVVTQPAFLHAKGDDYLRDVEPDDLPCLYPYASLLAAGVPTSASSDAPYGPVDPWQVVTSARDRTSSTGTVINAVERVPTRTALDSYLTPAHDPGGRPKRVAAGLEADLVLLSVPLEEALAHPDAELVSATWIAGVRIS